MSLFINHSTTRITLRSVPVIDDRECFTV